MYYGIINFAIYISALLIVFPLVKKNSECQKLMHISKEHIFLQLSIGFALALILVLVLGIINIAFFRSFAVFQFLKLSASTKVNFFVFQLLVAITEELLFRGYLLANFIKITKSTLLSAFITSVLFGLTHFLINHNTVQLIIAFSISLLFSITLINSKKCSIYSLILAHLLYDLAIINV